MLAVAVVRAVLLLGNIFCCHQVWYAAATQLFYSTNLAWGGMITMASYNGRTHNCFK